MILAVMAVRDGTMGANMASRTFGVPPPTLKDRISGRVKHGTKPGPIPYLDETGIPHDLLWRNQDVCQIMVFQLRSGSNAQASTECMKWMHEDCVCKDSEDSLVCMCGNVCK